MVTVSRLDNGNVLVHVDCVLKSGAVRRYFVTPDAKGGAAEGVDNVPFVRILGRAQRWKTLLATGAYGSKTALARALGVDKANLTSVLRLPYLSPVIVEKVGEPMADIRPARPLKIAIIQGEDDADELAEGGARHRQACKGVFHPFGTQAGAKNRMEGRVGESDYLQVHRLWASRHLLARGQQGRSRCDCRKVRECGRRSRRKNKSCAACRDLVDRSPRLEKAEDGIGVDLQRIE